MSKEKVNPNLFEYLKENETHLFEENNQIIAFVIVDFRDLENFVEIVGKSVFDDGGMEVRMFENHLAIVLNEIFELEDEHLSNYKNCFEKEEWNQYEKRIKRMEIFGTTKV